MLNAPVYECLHEMFRDIPSIREPGKSVAQEITDFNEVMKTHANSRVVDLYGCRLDVDTMGFTHRDRMQLLALTEADEDKMGTSIISDWFSPEFFKTNFWWMWATTFAFQPWHSAAELKRYMVRFMHEFPRIETLAGVERTPMSQYDSLIFPLQKWLEAHNVAVDFGCTVEDVQMDEANHKLTAKTICKGWKEMHCITESIGFTVYLKRFDDRFIHVRFLERTSQVRLFVTKELLSLGQTCRKTRRFGKCQAVYCESSGISLAIVHCYHEKQRLIPGFH
ncbi:Myosin-cross-reactive_antigen [Hexamita inflata]|uniref:Putative n=1 Tax=Hexamita inflata TaxID=28002 RepID=A0AA86V2J3_9EUKA|nr:Myosin-cross-reactive antigen [Hexamita inflata]